MVIFCRGSRCIQHGHVIQGTGTTMLNCMVEGRHSSSKRMTVDVKILISVRRRWGSLSGPSDWQPAGANARSIVQWYGILRKSDDVDGKGAESLFGSVAGFTLALTRNATSRGHDITKNHLHLHFRLSGPVAP